MPAFNYFNGTTQDLAEALHNFKTGSTAVYKVILIPTTAPVATNHLYADISANELATGNGYTAGGAAVTITDSLSGSTETVNGTLSAAWTASGTGITARYAVLYRSDSTNKELVGWWDYGSSFTVTSGNQLNITWASGVLTVTHA